MLSPEETIRRFVEADVKRNLPKMPAEVRLGCLCPTGRVLAPGGDRSDHGTVSHRLVPKWQQSPVLEPGVGSDDLYESFPTGVLQWLLGLILAVVISATCSRIFGAVLRLGFSKSKKFQLQLMLCSGHNRPIAVPKAEVEPRGGFWQLPREFQPNTT